MSLRLPMSSRLATAPAYGESGSTHALLSLPVMRKFIAVGSGSGNVSGGAVLDVAGTVVGASLPAGGAVVAVVVGGAATEVVESSG